jgi:hypothetical protein
VDSGSALAILAGLVILATPPGTLAILLVLLGSLWAVWRGVQT